MNLNQKSPEIKIFTLKFHFGIVSLNSNLMSGPTGLLLLCVYVKLNGKSILPRFNYLTYLWSSLRSLTCFLIWHLTFAFNPGKANLQTLWRFPLFSRPPSMESFSAICFFPTGSSTLDCLHYTKFSFEKGAASEGFSPDIRHPLSPSPSRIYIWVILSSKIRILICISQWYFSFVFPFIFLILCFHWYFSFVFLICISICISIFISICISHLYFHF